MSCQLLVSREQRSVKTPRGLCNNRFERILCKVHNLCCARSGWGAFFTFWYTTWNGMHQHADMGQKTIQMNCTLVCCVFTCSYGDTPTWRGVGVSCSPAWQIVTWGLGSYYYDFSFRTHPTFIVILLSRPLNVPVKMSSLGFRVLEAGENGGTHDARSDLTIQPRKE